MRNLLLTMLITAVTLFAGCKSEVPAGLFPESITFNMEDVELIELSNPRHIDLDPLAQPNSIEIYDTLLFVSGKSTVNDYALHIYSANSGKLLNSMIGLGRGPGELLQVFGGHLLPERKELIISEPNAAITVVYNLDSILDGPRMPFKQINYKNMDGYLNMVKIDEENYIVHGRMGIVKEGKPLQLMGKYSEKEGSLIASAPYPPLATVDSTIANNRSHIGRIFYAATKGISHNPKTDNIVISYSQTDLIEIYDTDLNLKLRIHGPDQIVPIFEFADMVPDQSSRLPPGMGTMMTAGNRRSPVPLERGDMILFPEEYHRECYGTTRTFDDGFYVFYSGKLRNKEDRSQQLIFFRYDGTPVVRYSFDIEHRGSIAIDHQKGVFYLLGQDREIYLYETTPLSAS